jgi:alcohol dehydrogenase class IV
MDPDRISPSFTIHTPRDIVFGQGKSALLPSLLPASVKRVLVVSGRHAAGAEAKTIADALTASGREVRIFAETMAEPSPGAVDTASAAVRAWGADAVVAIGGGSVIDTAKAAAALARLDGSCIEYFKGSRELNVTDRPFFAALPTTSGTGAEMTNNSVLTDPATMIKKSIRHPGMTADLAVVDPDLTMNCPRGVTVASGLDALVQAVEAFVSPKGTDYTRALSKAAACKLYGALKSLTLEPWKPAADPFVPDAGFRVDMAEGSMLAGMAFAHAGLGAVHGLAHPVGSLLHVPHGVSCAILMLPVFQFNMNACGRLYGELAHAFLPKEDRPDAALFIAAMRELSLGLGVPDHLRDYALSEEHLPFIVANCRSNSMKNNPEPMSDEQVETLLRSLI